MWLLSTILYYAIPQLPSLRGMYYIIEFTMLVPLILSSPGSSASESVVTQDTVEVDESLFQDLEDLELEET